MEALQGAGYDVVTLDSNVDRSTIRSRLHAAAMHSSTGNEEPDNQNQCDVSKVSRLTKTASIQGNFDVALLRKGSLTSPALCPADVQLATRAMLEALGSQGLIANLGEGLTGAEDPQLVAAFIDAVHDVSESMIAKDI